MIEQFNHTLFLLINATPASAAWKISVAVLIARYLILLVPGLAAVLWLWGGRQQLIVLRQTLVKTAVAMIVALCGSWLLGLAFPHQRPFALAVGYQFLSHAPDNSFPSDHGVVIFTFALSFLFFHRLWSGLALLVIGCAIAWSRIYLGVHWPVDMAGALLLALISCLISQFIWEQWGNGLFQLVSRVYRFCFALPLRKKWVKE